MPLTEGPLILAIETATRAGSISLARGSKVLGSFSGDPSASHSTDLLDNVNKLLRDARVKLADLDLFAAAVGPGSFTGIRIGLATVKALAICLGRRCVGISTLAAVAHAAGTSERTAALLPAGRGELYAQLFRVNGDEGIESLDGAAHLRPPIVLERYSLPGSLKWAGEGAHLHVDSLRSRAADQGIIFADGVSDSTDSEKESLSRWVLAPEKNRLAESVVALALVEYGKGRTIPASELRAFYVRPSDAEINERWHKQSPPLTRV